MARKTKREKFVKQRDDRIKKKVLEKAEQNVLKISKREIRSKVDEVMMRREFLDGLDRMKYKPGEIVEILKGGEEKEVNDKGKFHTMMRGVRDIMGMVKRDLHIVRKARQVLLYDDDVSRIRQDYIATLEELFRKCNKEKDYKTMVEIEDKIARMRGVDMEQVIRLKGDKENPIKVELYGLDELKGNR